MAAGTEEETRGNVAGVVKKKKKKKKNAWKPDSGMFGKKPGLHGQTKDSCEGLAMNHSPQATAKRRLARKAA